MKTESLEVAEQLGASGATGPRITLQYIVDQIDYYQFTKLSDVIDGTRETKDKVRHITLCVLVMKSGYVVIGKSAPMDPGNFDVTKGQTFAYEDCIRQLWPMFAFHQLQEKV